MSTDSPELESSIVVPWVVSGRTAQALSAQADRLLTARSPLDDYDVVDIARSLATTRTAFANRAVIMGSDLGILKAGLSAVADATPHPAVMTGVAHEASIGYLFPGQGTQRAGMGRGLWDRFAVFRTALEQTCAAFEAHLDDPLLDILFSSSPSARIDDTVHTQPALFAVEVALFHLLQSLGFRADLIAGHSLGEIAAAHVAGAFSLDDAAAMVAARGRLMQEATIGGAMVSTDAPVEEIIETLSGCEHLAGIAAYNSPTSTVVSGSREAVVEIASILSSRGRRVKSVNEHFAFHSPMVDSVAEKFGEIASRVAYHPPAIPIISNISGTIAGDEILDPVYWVSHMRQPVQFKSGIESMISAGVNLFIEVGPGSVASSLAADILSGTEQQVARHDFIPLLRSAASDESSSFLSGIARSFVAGADIDWKALFGDGELPPLPTYAFQRTSHGINEPLPTPVSPRSGRPRTEHGILRDILDLPDGRGSVFSGPVSFEDHPWLTGHVVLGSSIVPGTAFLELVSHIGHGMNTPHVDELTLSSPLAISEGQHAMLRVLVDPASPEGRRTVTVYSRSSSNSDAEWHQHATASLSAVTAPDGHLSATAVGTGHRMDPWPPIDVTSVEVSEVYDAMGSAGFEYGPEFRCLSRAWKTPDAVFSEVVVDGHDNAGFLVHPAVLDACLQSVAVLDDWLSLSDRVIRLPFNWTGARLHGASQGTLRVAVHRLGHDTISLLVSDGQGNAVLSVDSLTLRAVPIGQFQQAQNARPVQLSAVQWIPTTLTSALDHPRGHIVVGNGNHPFPSHTAEDGRVFESLDLLLDAVSAGMTAPEVVLIDCTTAGYHDNGIDTTKRAVNETVSVLQTWLAEPRLGSTTLAFLTSHANPSAAEDEIVHTASSAIWGLLRSAQSESPGRIAIIDIDDAPESAAALPDAVHSGVPQISIRNGESHVPVLCSLPTPAASTSADGLPFDDRWQLVVTSPGTLDSLEIRPDERAPRALGPHEIRIAIRAIGVNFRDVLIILGAYEGDATIGIEASGDVIEIGSEVVDLVPGQRVTGLVDSAFGATAVVDRRRVIPMLQAWTYTEAASVPVAFLTALHALKDIGRIGPDTAVLVHAAAGGVGTAAAQIARLLGATVYGTASPAKWDHLRTCGFEDDQIASSRDFEFSARWTRETVGGFDMILNSLTGQFIDESLPLLKPGGRFVEIGKSDTRPQEWYDTAHPAITRQYFDLSQVDNDHIAELLEWIRTEFERRTLTIPPITRFNLRDTISAFRQLGHGKNIGKYVVEIEGSDLTTGTVLITGGTGALGRAVARHLATHHGVRHLMLLSRRGAKVEGGTDLVHELAQLGATAELVSCDVADRDALSAVVATIPPGRRLTGVVHTAGVVQDGLIESISHQSVEAVLGPKAEGAFNLHQLTESSNVSLFVMFSSSVAVLGSAGQGCYAAANSYLDALARQRRQQGLPAVSIGWGLWANSAGMTRELNDLQHRRISRLGLTPMTDSQALTAFDAAISGSPAHVIGATFNLSTLRAQAADGEIGSLLRGLIADPVNSTRASNPRCPVGSLKDRLATMSDAERQETLIDTVKSAAAACLGFSSGDSIDTDRAFRDVGFDSLAAVELRNRLNSVADLALPATLTFDYPTPALLAAQLGTLLSIPHSPTPDRTDALFDRLTSVVAELLTVSDGSPDVRTRIHTVLSVLAPDVAARQDQFDDMSDDELFSYMEQR
ncbi:SDR family NAD(P)-dependent oxidoreductase [Nocardia abscessus]|uniref:SDR family NAD(P)-dependent oxidoreductase n=1 Tax=Nocardia abscessus TaxID=120957 RepID=UPI002456EE13|nr:SDR family NAD(P)-dependent oxidoreductase [Nocardia abscessus]